MSKIRLVVMAATVGLTIAGCGSDGGSSDGGSNGGGDPAADAVLFPDNFEGVCQGATVSAATPYDESAASHKAVYFTTYEDSLLDQSSELPTDWTVTFSPDGNALQAIDLVACAVRTAEEPVQTCEGYEDDGQDTGNKVNWHTATYDVSVREATTGEVLAEETVEADDKECPMFASFDDEKQTIDMYASVPKDKVVGLLKPFVQS